MCCTCKGCSKNISRLLSRAGTFCLVLIAGTVEHSRFVALWVIEVVGFSSTLSDEEHSAVGLGRFCSNFGLFFYPFMLIYYIAYFALLCTHFSHIKLSLNV